MVFWLNCNILHSQIIWSMIQSRSLLDLQAADELQVGHWAFRWKAMQINNFTHCGFQTYQRMLVHVRVCACTVCLDVPQTQHGAQWTHSSVHAHARDSGAATQHGDPQTLKGVGVKGLVGEGRRKSLLRLSPPYGEETNGNNFRRQRSLGQSEQLVRSVFKHVGETRAETGKRSYCEPTVSLVSFLFLAAARSSLESAAVVCRTSDGHKSLCKSRLTLINTFSWAKLHTLDHEKPSVGINHLLKFWKNNNKKNQPNFGMVDII